jgi:deazaflavin-dependent oxidoreductase (nitroreductase family)
VTSFKRRLVRIGNRIGVWMYRRSDGRLLSTKNAKVLMITAAPGRRTGALHSTCVRYLDTPEGLLVWGTASGAPSDPDWFRNLRKAEVADVQVGAKTLRAPPGNCLTPSATPRGKTSCWLRLPRSRNTPTEPGGRFQ